MIQSNVSHLPMDFWEPQVDEPESIILTSWQWVETHPLCVDRNICDYQVIRQTLSIDSDTLRLSMMCEVWTSFNLHLYT